MFWNLARPTLCPDYSTLYYIIRRCMRWDSHAMQVSLNTRTSEMLNHHRSARSNAATFELIRSFDHIKTYLTRKNFLMIYQTVQLLSC